MDKTKQSAFYEPSIWHRSLLYACCLFVIAISLLVYLYITNDEYSIEFNWISYVFFLLFGLFTIFKGFTHPYYGYVSFDRVAQISSILILGPLPAAIINGLASFVFPLVNDYLKGDKKAIVIAVLINTAMMILMILLSGLLFEYLGGKFQLLILDFKQFTLLCLLLVFIQLINLILMNILIKIKKQKLIIKYSLFTTIIEFGSGFAGILFALIYNNMGTSTIVLFVIIMVVVLSVINQFAIMRNQLEVQVKKRTQDLENKTKQLEFLATHDELTQLVNRRCVNSHIKNILSMEVVDNSGIFIAFADIDDFKMINDTFSHDVGDDVLIKIGNVLQQFCNERLIIARYGGEEFLLCFSHTNTEQVLDVCEQIRQKIYLIDLDVIQKDFKVSVSIGVANANKKSLHKTLVSRADNNLYKAKDSGKNQIIYE